MFVLHPSYVKCCRSGSFLSEKQTEPDIDVNYRLFAREVLIVCSWIVVQLCATVTATEVLMWKRNMSPRVIVGIERDVCANSDRL